MPKGKFSQFLPEIVQLRLIELAIEQSNDVVVWKQFQIIQATRFEFLRGVWDDVRNERSERSDLWLERFALVPTWAWS